MHMTAGTSDTVGALTKEGLRSLQAELEHLCSVERPAVHELVRTVRQDGALADNPVLLDVMEQQEQLEQRIAALRAHLATAKVTEVQDDGVARVGCLVDVLDLDTEVTLQFELVGPYESDPVHGRLSVESPIGRAVHGLSRGDVAEAETPGGLRRLRVEQVRCTPD